MRGRKREFPVNIRSRFSERHLEGLDKVAAYRGTNRSAVIRLACEKEIALLEAELNSEEDL